eukprot:scaffold85794_cov48-Phaeocystis_antarctica.AAC.3
MLTGAHIAARRRGARAGALRALKRACPGSRGGGWVVGDSSGKNRRQASQNLGKYTVVLQHVIMFMFMS